MIHSRDYNMAVLEEMVANASCELAGAEKSNDVAAIAYYQGVKDGLRMLAAALDVIDHRFSSSTSAGRDERPAGWEELVFFNHQGFKEGHEAREAENMESIKQGLQLMREIE